MNLCHTMGERKKGRTGGRSEGGREGEIFSMGWEGAENKRRRKERETEKERQQREQEKKK